MAPPSPLLPTLLAITLITLSCPPDATSAAVGRLHVANHFLGEQASLPCDVDFANCGNIYFLTWSKNVSGEWQRVYLYSESYQTALGDFAFGGGSRVVLDAGNMSKTGVASLRVKAVSVEDEGLYKCDVTYVHGKCPSLTYTELFTLVTPGEPAIRVNGKDIGELQRNQLMASGGGVAGNFPSGVASAMANVTETKGSSVEVGGSASSAVVTVGPFEESATMALECTSVGGRPMADVKWYNGSRAMRSKVTFSSTSNGPTVVATVRFILSRHDLGAKFTCRVWNNATVQPLSARVALDVHVKPLSLRVRGPTTPVVAGEMVTLTCAVEGARPAATVDWFNRSEIVTPHPMATTDLMSDGTYRTTSTLVFIASRYDHKRDFFCMGTNQLLKNRHEVPLLEPTTLKVLYPPAVRLEPDGPVAVNESATVTIRCTFDANPPNVTEVVWYRSGLALNGPDAAVANHRKLPRPGGLGGGRQPFLSYEAGLPTLSIANVTRNESARYSCHLKNAFGRGNSTRDAFVDVYYPPTVTIDVSPSSAIETGRPSVTLSCRALDGNPRTLVRVTWFRNAVYLETTAGEDLVLANVSRSDAGNYSCQGYNGAAKPSPASEPRELRVQYAPSRAQLSFLSSELAIETEVGSGPATGRGSGVPGSGGGRAFAMKGSRAALRCSVAEDTGNPAFDRYVWTKDGLPVDVVGPTLNIETVNVAAQGNYSCSAANSVGSGPPAHVRLMAKAPPKLLRGLPVHGGALKNSSVTLFCRVECQPICQIEWFKNNVSLGVGSPAADAATHPDTGHTLSGRESREVPTSLGWQRSSTKRQTWPPLAFGISSLGHRTVQVPSDHFAIKTMEHKEQEDDNLLASVTSYLHIRSGATVEDNDVFSCASESNGAGPSATSSTVYKVESAPENVRTTMSHLEMLEGDLMTTDKVVTCGASAKPPPSFVWMESSSGKTVSRGPRLTFTEEDFEETSGLQPPRALRDWNGNYSCVVTNRHGSASTSVSVTVLYPPECQLRRRFIGIEGRAMLACDAQSNPPVYNFTWHKNNRTITEVSSSKREQQAAYMESDSGDGSSKQSAVLVLVDGDFESYSCIASNTIGTSRPCKLAVQQMSAAPSGWAQRLLKDENLMIAAAAAGGVVFIIGAVLVVAGLCAVRQRLKHASVPLELRRAPGSGLDPRLSDRYAAMAIDAAYSQQKQLLSKLAPMHHVDSNGGQACPPDARDMLTIMSECDQLSSSVSCSSPLKSPLIRSGGGHTSVLRRADGGQSPLLSDYITDEESGGNGSSADGSVAQHFYERPASLIGPSHFATTARGLHGQMVRPLAHHVQDHYQPAHHSSFHHLNIPLTSVPLPPPPPPLPPDRRYQPHYARPPTQDELEQLHQLTLPSKAHQLRAFARTRSRSGFGAEFE